MGGVSERASTEGSGLSAGLSALSSPSMRRAEGSERDAEGYSRSVSESEGVQALPGGGQSAVGISTEITK